MAVSPFMPGYVPENTEGINPVMPGYYAGKPLPRKPIPRDFLAPIEFSADELFKYG